jgi:hypothetical protein
MMCGQASLALEVNRETFDFPKEMDAVQSACDAFKRDRDLTAFHSAIRRRLHYIDANAPRRDNTFYIWDLAQLAKPCGPA